jgi:hypothetical protein
MTTMQLCEIFAACRQGMTSAFTEICRPRIYAE